MTEEITMMISGCRNLELAVKRSSKEDPVRLYLTNASPQPEVKVPDVGQFSGLKGTEFVCGLTKKPCVLYRNSTLGVVDFNSPERCPSFNRATDVYNIQGESGFSERIPTIAAYDIAKIA